MKRLRKSSYRAKLMAGFMFIAVLPTLIVGLLSYRFSVKALEKEAKAAAQQSLQQTCSSISEKLNAIVTASDIIASNNHLQRVLRNTPQKDAYTQIVDAKTSYSFFSSVTSNSSVYRIRMFTKANLIYTDDKLYFFPFEEMADMNIPGLGTSSDYGRVQWTPAYRLYDNSYSQSFKYVISAYRMIIREGSPAVVDNIFFVDMQVSDLYQEISLMKERFPGRSALISDENGLVICSTDDGDIWGQPSEKYSNLDLANSVTDHAGTMVLSMIIEPTGWRLVAALPYSDIAASGLPIRNMTIFITMLMLALTVFLSNIFSKSYSNRIGTLISSVEGYVQSFQHTSPTIEKPLMEDTDEIGALSDTFEWMRRQLDYLVFDVYKTQLEVNQANLRALQEQIKPHFLYNILGSVKSSLDVGNTGRATDLVVALADFFRLALSGGEEVITIAKEIAMVKKYVHLQNLLYPGVFALETDMDEDVQEFLIIRFCLQPLVENAIKHAFIPDGIRGLMRISCRFEGNGIVITVEDNGIGMSAQKASRLNEDLRAGVHHAYVHGFGLHNVNARLKLRYGPSYGLTVYSEPGAGTRMQIIIPPDF